MARAGAVDFEYVFDGPRLLGTGGALRRALPTARRPFFVLYGDSYSIVTIARSSGRFARAASRLDDRVRNDDRWDASNVLFDDGRIVRYDKRHRTPAMQHIDYGLGVVRAEALEPLSADDEPFDLATVYQDLLARGRRWPATKCRRGSTKLARRTAWRRRAHYLRRGRESDDELRTTAS